MSVVENRTPGGFHSIKVKSPSGDWVKRGAGTSDLVTVRYMDAMCQTLVSKQARDVVEEIARGRRDVADVYAMWMATPKRPGRNGLMDPADDERLEYVRGRLSAVDLDVVLDTWKGGGTAEDITGYKNVQGIYYNQVRKLVVKGTPFPLADWTTPRLQVFLNSLDCGAKTARRYKTALSQFSRFLQANYGLVGNPARGGNLLLPKLPRKQDEDVRFLDEAEARGVVAALDHTEQQAMEALMFGTGVEWQACERMRVKDVDLARRMVFARGGKTGWRRRWVEVTEDWCWDIFARYVAIVSTQGANVSTQGANARLFMMSPRAAMERHVTACRKAEVTRTTFHQYRHSFAVMWIKRGVCGGLREDTRDVQWLKNQLGHAPQSVLYLTTYGVYINAVKLTRDQERRLGIRSAEPQETEP